ncbi:Heterokaryon incompatibility protein 6 like [Verticillium longisporum]|nr:Heterokaryon incompatibility protein 6 like [Verticillium longisporum]
MINVLPGRNWLAALPTALHSRAGRSGRLPFMAGGSARRRPERAAVFAPKTMTSYIPLNQPRQIRIIHLAPGSREDLLCGTIETVLLGEASYEALSYEWGAPDRVCNFGLEHGSIPITTSRHQTLRDLRRKAGVRTIWADGICINQDDLVERTKQVTLMGETYKNASRVLTYIGPDADDSSSAIEFAANLVAFGVSRLRHSDPRIHISRGATQPRPPCHHKPAVASSQEGLDQNLGDSMLVRSRVPSKQEPDSHVWYYRAA